MATASAQASGVPMLMLNRQFAAPAFNQMLSACAALMSIAAGRTAAEPVERKLRLVRDTMTSSVVAASRLSGATGQPARRALKPVHTRVSGNIRRLGIR